MPLSPPCGIEERKKRIAIAATGLRARSSRSCDARKWTTAEICAAHMQRSWQQKASAPLALARSLAHSCLGLANSARACSRTPRYSATPNIRTSFLELSGLIAPRSKPFGSWHGAPQKNAGRSDHFAKHDLLTKNKLCGLGVRNFLFGHIDRAFHPDARGGEGGRKWGFGWDVGRNNPTRGPRSHTKHKIDPGSTPKRARVRNSTWPCGAGLHVGGLACGNEHR